MTSAAPSRFARLLPRVLLASVALVSWGCGSPQAMSGIGARIFSALPGLSYVNGDVEAGTTTLASLPLLTYRTTEEHEGFADSEAWILPLLGRFAQTDRYVRLTWDGQAQGPPPDWWDRERKREGKPRKRKRKRTRSDPEPSGRKKGPETGTGVPPSKPKRSKEPRKRKKGKKGKKSKAPAPQGSATIPGKEHLLLRLERAGKIVRQLPQQKTQWDILFGLIGHHAERPARVLVRHSSKGAGKKRRKGKRRKGDVVYEVGPTRDSFRLLPLFSYRRGPEGKQVMFWPLLIGWEREGEERYMRLFYFLKIPLR